ncbi:peptidoglycan-binding protein [Frankia sp. CcI156]|uniref:antibiotic biosynthesis monooxygenase n=1 Tax=Frankia TaxID=1854 RepID=UPI0006914F30|nr:MULTISPECIES: antibiotic biosynthesis monooxygenase [Frankia]OFB43801.1 peptidoglycan-binding protein [Frankia sp. CgIM4]ONH28964.1 peptidoglycan-binding protein [Frankia sp. CcI156]TFE34432.1 peptidoglycan-binding protein [Frankia sp. B2]
MPDWAAPTAGAPVVAQIAFAVPGDAVPGDAVPGGAGFAAAARPALDALARAPGFRGGRIAQALDEPGSWLMTTEWDGPGAWRRALSAFEVRYALTPLLVFAVDGPGTFEVLVSVDGPGGSARTHRSDRTPDADTAAPGEPPRSVGAPGAGRP